MCDHPDRSGLPLTFEQFAEFLREPPHEPCDSELKYLTDEEYGEAFDEAERLYRSPVTGYIAHIVRDYDKARDLAQEVFMNVYRVRSSLEKAYIYRAARNAALESLHRSRRRSILEARWAGIRRYGDKGTHKVKRQPPSAEYLERTREEAFKRAVERLPDRYRAPLSLYADGKSFEQIMDITRARSEKVLESRICVAKSLLRKRLRRYL